MKRWWKRTGLVLLAVAVLAAAAGQGLAAVRGVATGQAVDSLLQGIRAAGEAAPGLVRVAAGGDLEAFRAAYRRFDAALEPVLGQIGAADPGLAARMASASSAIRQMMMTGRVTEEDVAREVAVIRAGLDEAEAMMAPATAPSRQRLRSGMRLENSTK